MADGPRDVEVLQKGNDIGLAASITSSMCPCPGVPTRVSGTWSGLFPSQKEMMRSMVLIVGLQWKVMIPNFQRKSRQLWQKRDDT